MAGPWLDERSHGPNHPHVVIDRNGLAIHK